MKRLFAIAALVAAGCVSVSEDVGTASDVGADAVMVVGKIEIRPPIKPEEQTYKAGWDVFNTKRHFIGRAILFTSDKPEYRERTSNALNPPLEETYFVKLPKAQRYVVNGGVTMSLVAHTSRRSVSTEQSELVIPPFQLDVRPEDKAIYVGTIRLHRDEFHEVTKAELIDEYASATAEFRKRFPGEPRPRRALLKSIRR